MQLELSIIILFSLMFASTKAVERSSRIVIGTDAAIEEFPFMVSLRLNDKHNCAGTILNERWILTGAICVDGEPIASISILYASTNLRETGPNIIYADEYIIHEKFNESDSFIHDIALVRLKSPMSFKLFDWKVKLAVKGSVYPSGMASVTPGWENNDTYGALMTTLQKVNLRLYTASECGVLNNEKVHRTQICAGIEGGYKGECYGDAGGPLLVNGVQVGIISQPDHPGVSTAVAYYVDWIQEKIGLNMTNNMFLIGL